jgi:death-on-curing protein
VRTTLKQLSVEAVIAIHNQVLDAHGSGSGMRSRELLESAVAAPQATMRGAPMISDPIEIAAAYLFYLCANHAFVDGNTRVALATCLVFLSENGLLQNEFLAVDDWENLTLAVASGSLTRADTTARLRDLLA